MFFTPILDPEMVVLSDPHVFVFDTFDIGVHVLGEERGFKLFVTVPLFAVPSFPVALELFFPVVFELFFPVVLELFFPVVLELLLPLVEFA